MSLGFAPETIELWPVERLRPYAQSGKTHRLDQVARIAASIAEFGWTVPGASTDTARTATSGFQRPKVAKHCRDKL